MSSGLGLYNKVVKATARFGGTGFSAYVGEESATCPLCHKPDVRMKGNQTLDQHIEHGNYIICQASGKSLDRASRMYFDENFNLIDEDLTEEEEEL